MKLILYSALLCFAACNVKNDTEVPQTALIVDQNLAEAYQDVQAAMTKKRTPIEFQGGEIATDCARYMTLRSDRNLVEGVNNKIIKSEYVICEALSILEAAEPAEVTPPTSLEGLYSQLDLTSFPSALRPQLHGEIKTLKQLSGLILESTPTRLSVDIHGIHNTFTLAAIADVSGDGEGDWIVWLGQTLSDGNYHHYQTLVIAAPNTSGELTGAY